MDRGECSVVTEMREIDVEERRKVDDFFEQGCGCKLFDGRQCCYAFSREHICSIRDQCSSLDRSALNNILFGHMATVRSSEKAESRGHLTKEREKIASFFFHEGRKVKCN